MTTTWTCIHRPQENSLDETVYVSKNGLWYLAKEYYASGASMFSWMLSKTDPVTGRHSFAMEFNTKRAATAYVYKAEA